MTDNAANAGIASRAHRDAAAPSRTPAAGGRVFYDAECRACRAMARRFARILARRRFELVPLQSEGAAEALRVEPLRLLDEMRLRRSDGTISGGAAAIVEIARQIWWAWPLWAASRLPGAMRVLDAAYRGFARHRTCASGACAVERSRSHRIADFAPLLLLVSAAALSRSRLTPWVFMWTMAGALYAGCKWLTYRRATRELAPITRRRSLAYLLLWPGMDARAFLTTTDVATPPSPREWFAPVLKVLSGAVLTWLVAPRAWPLHPILACWVGMIGFALMLHFGLFHLLWIFWRSRGIHATPLMRSPLRPSSISDLWGRRWNTAYHQLVVDYTFLPLRAIVGPAAATLFAFLVSGLVHELVITVPARAGYGLPTAYFLLQGAAVLGERSRLGRKLRLGHGFRGWAFAALVSALPAYWLFPPSFIRNIVLPMFSAIGALGRHV